MTDVTDMTGSTTDSTRMVTALVRLHKALQDATIPLDHGDSDEPRRARAAMISQLEDYLIPRTMSIEAPLLAVVGGSTGAGKSTLVNSLIGERVTASGVLRPTTRSPVLVHHPDDAAWFGQDRLLPELERVDRATDDPHALQLVASDKLRPGLAILDAPDVDSVEEQNRELAALLLSAADLWVFVTSAARYADQVPWEFLKQAASRSTAVAIVLDRTSAEAVGTVATHLARMLASRGLKDSPLFIVHEGEVDAKGLLPDGHVGEVRGWLDLLADDAAARHRVVMQTLDGAIRAVSLDVHTIADSAELQSGSAAQLRTDAVEAYDLAVSAVNAAITDGTLLRGEVWARWREFVDTGGLVRSLEGPGGKVRGRVLGALRGKPQQIDQLRVAVESGLEMLILEHAEAAAELVHEEWQATGAGAGLLADLPDGLDRASRQLRAHAQTEIRQWQDEVRQLVEAQPQPGAADRTYPADGLAVAVMILTAGSENAATREDVAPERKLVDAVLGGPVVTSLAQQAQASLEHRVARLLDSELARYTQPLEALQIDPEAPAALREAARRVVDCRFATKEAEAASEEHQPEHGYGH